MVHWYVSGPTSLLFFANDDIVLAAKYYWQSIYNNPYALRSYLYFVFSLLPIRMTRFVRRLKTLKKF